MFFRRQRPKPVTLQDRIELLRQAGFQTAQRLDGRTLVTKHGVAAIVGEETPGHTGIERAGILIGPEIAVLCNGGYQMFLQTPNGKRYPATADQLHALHQFEEDVKETLGLVDLYNTSLGTTSTLHRYDRVQGREIARQPKPWLRRDNRYKAPETKGSLHI